MKKRMMMMLFGAMISMPVSVWACPDGDGDDAQGALENYIAAEKIG